MRPIAAALAVSDSPDERRLVLRDGSVASVRPATAEDVPVLTEFFRRLSPESRYQRFMAAGEAPDSVIARLSTSADPSCVLTLVAERTSGIVAVASYCARNAEVAEAAFAVADQFQGKGLGTALLERLAVAAATAGFRRFEATTLVSNTRMLAVFRDSGFEIRSKSEGGCVDVQLALAAGVAKEEERNRMATAASADRPLHLIAEPAVCRCTPA